MATSLPMMSKRSRRRIERAKKNPVTLCLCSGALLKCKNYFGALVGAGVLGAGIALSAVGAAGACGAGAAEPVVVGEVEVLAVLVSLLRLSAKIPMITARAMMPPMIQPV
jgi:hypothetical protein